MLDTIFSFISLLLSFIIGLFGIGGGTVTEKEYTLSNQKASEKTKAIYEFINEAYGERVLTGQQESTWIEEDYELNYIEAATGKLPAICGFDYMHDDFDGVNSRAEKWADKGGIVTICWHTGSDFCGEWVDAMNDAEPNWDKIFTDGTEENKAFLDGMDKGAIALKKLQEKDITVLWRPFHEFDGQWFWWGKGGSENFKKLWVMMYDRYTNYWGLDNLIWVLGYSHVDTDKSKWYPGDEYCDIIGADSYDGGAQPELYSAVLKLSKNKAVCFHECGANPTAYELSSTKWAFFMTWHTTYLTDNNTKEELNELYNSEIAITLDELPEF